MSECTCDRCTKIFFDDTIQVYELYFSIGKEAADKIYLCNRCYQTFQAMVDSFLETEVLR